jgi:hypothetical protein
VAKKQNTNRTTQRALANQAQSRIVPLGGGTHAYLIDADGSNRHLKLGTEDCTAAIAELPEALRTQVISELEALALSAPAGGWATQVEMLNAALVVEVEAAA